MQPTDQRMFFALWPDASTRQHLESVVRQLPDHHGRATHPMDWHITLVFLGSVAVEQRDCVNQVADRIEGAAFRLQLDELGYWRRPRILWCGCSQTREPLGQLVSDLQLALRGGCGFKPESRPYVPHVTLARKARMIECARLTAAVPWRVREFVLAVSSGAAKPPRYQIVKRWSLTA